MCSLAVNYQKMRVYVSDLLEQSMTHLLWREVSPHLKSFIGCCTVYYA